MNFNIFFILIISIVISSCGVKGPPAIPKDENYKSYINQFQSPKAVKTEEEKKEEEEKDKKKQE